MNGDASLFTGFGIFFHVLSAVFFPSKRQNADFRTMGRSSAITANQLPAWSRKKARQEWSGHNHKQSVLFNECLLQHSI